MRRGRVSLSEERSPEALRWNELSALYDLYTRDQFTPQDPAPASQSMEEDGGRALWEAALPVHVESLAKALGVEVVVEERLQPLVEGYIQGNAIHLPPSSPDAAMEILRHELTHRMQELSPRQYGKYRDYVIRQYTAADAAAKYEAYRRAGHPLTPEQVVDELVADYAGRHLREEGAIRRLAGENRTLAEWVRETIRALAERIREKLGRAEPTLEYAQRLWERAFRAAEQHASRQNTSVPLPGPETPARYSIREEIDSSHSEEYTVENAGKGDIGAEKSSSSSIGRMDLAGKTHPVSGVKFDSNGFPIFESIYSTRLEPQDYMKSRSTHFDRASKALYSDIMNDSNLRSKFAEEEIAIFKEGGIPKVYTWHHHQDEGVMQLVDRKIHRQTGHIGGFGIWGSGN